ncbi:MAG TPA: Rieske 2Fe-2S domain-containing protein [Candidatus Binatia bacterium]|nr:Rieske 2Fe-2S domain-containing protein [Candidatus Binatia bacterium]
MMTQEENNLLTQTARSTPCGELMRRYWQPAALSEELSSEKPLAVQLLGEELVLFRDGEGKPALIGRYCAHQGVDMIYGHVEKDGIRCMYHGWLFDACGKVIVRGSWVEGGEKRMEVGQPAYRCVELGGVILTYMGPGDPPELPLHEFLTGPAENRAVSKILLNGNFLQAEENGINPAEFSLLEVESTDFGLRVVTTQKLEAGKQHIRVTSFIYPSLIAFNDPAAGEGYSVHWHVPIDDRTYAKYVFLFNRERPLTDEVRNSIQVASNTESQDVSLDRAHKAFVAPDNPLLAARSFLLKAIREIGEDREPPHILRALDTINAPSIFVLSETIPADTNLQDYLKNLEK